MVKILLKLKLLLLHLPQLLEPKESLDDFSLNYSKNGINVK